MNNPQPQVDVDGAVKALFAAGADYVSGWDGLDMIWTTEPYENPQGDAPRADVVAWINAKLAAGQDWVELRIENDDIINIVAGEFL